MRRCGFNYGSFRIEYCLALCSRVFSPFSIVIISTEEERAGLRASRTFVCLFYTL